MLMMEFSIVSASKSEGVANPECDYAAPRERIVINSFPIHAKKNPLKLKGWKFFRSKSCEVKHLQSKRKMSNTPNKNHCQDSGFTLISSSSTTAREKSCNNNGGRSKRK